MAWSDLRPWGIKWRHIALVIFAVLLIRGGVNSCGTFGRVPEVRIAAGSLEREWPNVAGKSFNVAMRNGRYEETRSNDIEELAKDYWHFKNSAVDALAASDMRALDGAEKSFRDVRRWLDAYDEADVKFILERTSRRR